MPRLPKTDSVLEGGKRRKPVGRVRKPGVQSAGLRPNPSRRDGAASAPATAETSADLLIEQPASQTGDNQENIRPADRVVTPETLAAIDAADAPESGAAQAANGLDTAERPAGSSAGETPAPAAPDATREDCIDEARMLLDTLAALVKDLEPNPIPKTTAALQIGQARDNLATALGGVMHFYGLTGAGIIAHPLGALGLALIPFALPAWHDFKAWRAKKAEQAAAAAPPPPPVNPGVASIVATPMAPASNLAERA